MSTAAYAAFDPTSPLKPHTITRREVGPHDVAIDITHCGVCHSDIHTARSEWSAPTYPVVPGHEIIGTVTAIGAEVKRHQVGDTVGVGCMVDSCRECECCEAGLEQHCVDGPTYTYGSDDRVTGGKTHGGYSDDIVVDEDFVVSIPENLDRAAAAPLLCAGITTWSPLRRFNVTAGRRIGVLGLGGLGHMAVKLASALGAEVVVFTSSPGKVEDARRFGASEVILPDDRAGFKALKRQLDLIINTVSAPFRMKRYLDTLGVYGTMAQVGLPSGEAPVDMMALVHAGRSLTGSSIGSIAETREMLAFCGQHNITADVEVIPMQETNAAWERVLKSDVKYRFTIEMG